MLSEQKKKIHRPECGHPYEYEGACDGAGPVCPGDCQLNHVHNFPANEQTTEQKEQNALRMSYGQKAVGLTFNPSNDPTVQKVKELYAEIIDLCNDAREAQRNSGAPDPEKNRLYTDAIREAQGAQMWAVKAITWKV